MGSVVKYQFKEIKLEYITEIFYNNMSASFNIQP